MLHGRAAIAIKNVPGLEKRKCDQILVAAPNLSRGQECFNEKQFDCVAYAAAMYTMYNNVMRAIAAEPDKSKPIVFTLPGAGVYLGKDPVIQKQAKIIHALVLKKTIIENAPQLQGRKFVLPYADQLIYNIVHDKLDLQTDSVLLKDIKQIEATLSASKSESKDDKNVVRLWQEQPGVAAAPLVTLKTASKPLWTQLVQWITPQPADITPTAIYAVNNENPNIDNPNRGHQELAIKFKDQKGRDEFKGQFKNAKMLRDHKTDEKVVIIKMFSKLPKSSLYGGTGIDKDKKTLVVTFPKTEESEKDKALLINALNASTIKFESVNDNGIQVNTEDLSKKETPQQRNR